MATKKKPAKKTAKRRAPVAKKKATRRKGSGRMSLQKALMEVVKGVAGAVIVTKFGDMVPVKDPRIRHGLLTLGGAYLASKPGDMRAVGIGAGISAGTMLVADFMPNILAPSTTVGRLSPATVARMQAAAERTRGAIGGYRQRTVVGTGAGDDFPQPVQGTRSRTIVGGGGGYDPGIAY